VSNALCRSADRFEINQGAYFRVHVGPHSGNFNSG
jgi:hypothetical protein